MPKTKEALLEEAKKLNISVEGLEYNDLRSAVAEARKAADTSNTPPPDTKGKSASGDNPDADNPDFGVETPSSDRDIEVNAANERFLNAQKEAKVKRNAHRKQLAKEAKKRETAKNSSKSKQEAGKQKGKDGREVFEDDRGLKFRFTKTAPESLNIDGRSRKVSDIIKDEETMLELVYGNSNFIEQIY
ncbi:hypothetical protein LCGC14_1786400 [marine sediment metagenome]|uniref:Uncharacterized protein n=2 Tax=root TaxID=1 RepID=A0A831QKP0_9FLAO|nr:hypothetical protein [Pricia antarctica]